MEENLEIPENEQLEKKGYPGRKFTIIFSIIIALLVIITLGDRFIPSREADVSSSVDDALNADFIVKYMYALKYFNEFIPEVERNSVGDVTAENMKMAAANYRQAIYKQPSLDYIRRLLIVSQPEYRPKVIRYFNNSDLKTGLKQSGKASINAEVAMWRDIYLSGTRISAAKTGNYIYQIKQFDMGWFEHLALSDLYANSAIKDADSLAAKEQSAAVENAVWVMGWLLILAGSIFVAGFGGIAFLIVYLVRISKRRQRKIPMPVTAINELADTDRSLLSGYLLESFLAYILIMIGVQIFAAPVIMAFNGGSIDLNGIASTIAGFITYVLSGLLALLYLIYRLNKAGFHWSIIGLRTSNAAEDTGWGMAGYAAVIPLLLISMLITSAVEKYLPTPINPIVPDILKSDSVIGRIMLFSMVSIGAPFFEEIFFRGVLFNSLRARWGVLAGILISASIFAFLHPFPLNFLPIFMLGSVFTVLTYERNSLLPNMVAHSINNTIIFIMLILTSG